jgi:hypothetical protein
VSFRCDATALIASAAGSPDRSAVSLGGPKSRVPAAVLVRRTGSSAPARLSDPEDSTGSPGREAAGQLAGRGVHVGADDRLDEQAGCGEDGKAERKSNEEHDQVARSFGPVHEDFSITSDQET